MSGFQRDVLSMPACCGRGNTVVAPNVHSHSEQLEEQTASVTCVAGLSGPVACVILRRVCDFRCQTLGGNVHGSGVVSKQSASAAVGSAGTSPWRQRQGLSFDRSRHG